MAINLTKPIIGGDKDAWGQKINANIDKQTTQDATLEANLGFGYDGTNKTSGTGSVFGGKITCDISNEKMILNSDLAIGLGGSTGNPLARLDLKTGTGGKFLWYNDNDDSVYHGTKGGVYLDMFGLFNNTTLVAPSSVEDAGTFSIARKDTESNIEASITQKFTLSLETGNLSISGSYSPFTGVHIATSDNDLKINELVKIRSLGFEVNNPKQPIWNATYANIGDKGIFGVVYDILHIYDKVEVLDEKTGKTNIIDGELIEEKYLIACVGDMPCVVNAEGGNIEYGDILIQSSKNGEAMAFKGEYVLPNKIIGYAGEDVVFGEDEVNRKIGITKE